MVRIKPPSSIAFFYFQFLFMQCLIPLTLSTHLLLHPYLNIENLIDALENYQDSTHSVLPRDVDWSQYTLQDIQSGINSHEVRLSLCPFPRLFLFIIFFYTPLSHSLWIIVSHKRALLTHTFLFTFSTLIHRRRLLNLEKRLGACLILWKHKLVRSWGRSNLHFPLPSPTRPLLQLERIVVWIVSRVLTKRLVETCLSLAASFLAVVCILLSLT